jgi:glycosyltransferase involved in cell wall biosynthesis
VRIAVTTIALNEEKHVERWAESAADADLLMIADTGSTDATVIAAEDCGVEVGQVRVRPWRFDTARNAALALLPDDIDLVITLDMDEVLAPGWRDRIEAAPRARRLSYDYVWNWTEDEQPGVQFRGDRCHARFGYQWKHPVHEVLVATGSDDPAVYAGFAIHHHADDTKPRSQYLPLLRRAVAEAPDDDRLAHYYARELYFTGDWAKAREEFIRHLGLPSAAWPPERAQSYRYLAKMDDYPERWLLKAVAEDPLRREPWVDLARLYARQGMGPESSGAAARALRITARPTDYMTEPEAWDDAALEALRG